VTATRHTFAAGIGEMKRYVSYGASPRASIALVTGARALAFLQGRDYVLPEDVRELALDVLRHRMVLSYEALADDVTPDVIITKVLDAVAAPDVVLSGR
jgi:MoxR-like ATPase